MKADAKKKAEAAKDKKKPKAKAVPLSVKLANLEQARIDRAAAKALSKSIREDKKNSRRAARKAAKKSGGSLAGLRQIGSKTRASRTSRSSIKTT
tara:strand:- start:114 stop:398 length:285 start_codon:yes stop_codon:yes gene_type:complete